MYLDINFVIRQLFLQQIVEEQLYTQFYIDIYIYKDDVTFFPWLEIHDVAHRCHLLDDQRGTMIHTIF